MTERLLNLTEIIETVQLVGENRQYEYTVGLSLRYAGGLWCVSIDCLKETYSEEPLQPLNEWCEKVGGRATMSFASDLGEATRMGVVIFGTNMLDAAKEAVERTCQFLEKALEISKNEDGHQLPRGVIGKQRAYITTAELFYRNCGEILRVWRSVCDKVSQTFELPFQPFPNISYIQIDWQTIYQALEKEDVQKSNQLISECLQTAKKEMKRIDAVLTPRRRQTQRGRKK